MMRPTTSLPATFHHSSHSKYNVLPTLHEIVKSVIKEKVVRVIISTLKNLLLQAPEENVAPLLGNKFLPAVENLCARKWSDADISEDLEFIKEELTKNMAHLRWVVGRGCGCWLLVLALAKRTSPLPES